MTPTQTMQDFKWKTPQNYHTFCIVLSLQKLVIYLIYIMIM